MITSWITHFSKYTKQIIDHEMESFLLTPQGVYYSPKNSQRCIEITSLYRTSLFVKFFFTNYLCIARFHAFGASAARLFWFCPKCEGHKRTCGPASIHPASQQRAWDSLMHTADNRADLTQSHITLWWMPHTQYTCISAYTVGYTLTTTFVFKCKLLSFEKLHVFQCLQYSFSCDLHQTRARSCLAGQHRHLPDALWTAALNFHLYACKHQKIYVTSANWAT